jgi:hypothetical protein
MATSILYTLLDIQIPLPRYVKYLEQLQLEAEYVSRLFFGVFIGVRCCFTRFELVRNRTGCMGLTVSLLHISWVNGLFITSFVQRWNLLVHHHFHHYQRYVIIINAVCTPNCIIW